VEPTKFDDLTKALATATSRRQALKTIAATTIGGVLGLAGIGTAFGAPKCHRNGLGCDTNSQCCSGYCDPTTGTCACPSGQTNCSGTCVNTQNDPNNCGGCGNVCPAAGLACINGGCTAQSYFTCGCATGTVASCASSPCTASTAAASCSAFCSFAGLGSVVSSTCSIGCP
jgi:hypothetical protein